MSLTVVAVVRRVTVFVFVRTVGTRVHVGVGHASCLVYPNAHDIRHLQPLDGPVVREPGLVDGDRATDALHDEPTIDGRDAAELIVEVNADALTLANVLQRQRLAAEAVRL